MLYFCITVPAAIALFVSFIINIFVVAVFAQVSRQQTLNVQGIYLILGVQAAAFKGIP